MKKLVVILMLILASCSSKYKTDNFQAPSQPLSSSRTAYVMMARDGYYGAKTYAGSGRTVSQNLHSAISVHLSKSELAQTTESLDQALAKARAMAAAYLFDPMILNWEDRATQWSGRPDRISIKITVWDAASGKKPRRR